MNIVFVCHTNFLANSAIQVFHLANALADAGCECVCIVPHGKETVSACGAPNFEAHDFQEAITNRLTFSNGRSPSLIHAWTPREPVRKISERLARRYRCPIVVHLEDNEDLVTAAYLGLEVAELLQLPADELDRRLLPFLSHPRKSKDFLERAIGVTVLIEKLCEQVPDGVPVQLFWPSCDPELFQPAAPNADLRKQLGISEAEIVLTYNGNVHQANACEVRSLYLSVLFLNRMEYPARLIRLGAGGMDFLGNAREAVAPYVIDLGTRPNHEVPKYLALATALVQPGRSDPFNDFRFPSKIPEFLAMQRPVVLPRSNIGLHMQDGENCLLLNAGHAGEIVDRVLTLSHDPALADRLARAGRRFFELNLSWKKAAQQVMSFYDDLIGDRSAGPGHAADRELTWPDRDEKHALSSSSGRIRPVR